MKKRIRTPEARRLEYLKRKQKMLENQLCLTCGQKNENIQSPTCNTCKVKKNALRRQKRLERSIIGICACGNPRKNNSTECHKCHNNGLKEAAIRRAKNIKNMKCISCGKDKKEDRVACSKCNNKAKESKMKSYESYIHQNLCRMCGNKLNTKNFRCNQCNKNHSNNSKRKWSSLKLKVLEHYGNKCVCCGEKNNKFLTIDHIYNNGGEHRKQIGNRHIYKWIIDNSFPNDLQILCFNCNCGKSRNNNICPHKSKENRKINKNRSIVIAHYGSKCTCCGESNALFLDIDHINNDGNKHRIDHFIKTGRRLNISKYIIENDFPITFQLLCTNCNITKSLFGCCPHKDTQ